VTPLSAPVDVFVSASAGPSAALLPPRAGAAGWAALAGTYAVAAPGVAITVNPSDVNACAAPCVYYLAVRAGAGALEGVVSFSVLARTAAAVTVALEDGRATVNALAPP
jgi:hypothetical protein